MKDIPKDWIELAGLTLPANTVMYTGSAATNSLFVGNRIALNDGQPGGSAVDGIVDRMYAMPNGTVMLYVRAVEEGGRGAGQLLLTSTGLLALVKNATARR